MRDEYMTEERIARLIEGIAFHTRAFREWVAEGRGLRGGFYAVCPCCGNPYLYLDIDFADPCPICLAPATAVAARCPFSEIAGSEDGHGGIALHDARRNFVLHEQIYPPGHPRHRAEGPPGAICEMDFMCLTAELLPEEWDLGSIAEDYFQMAKAELKQPRAGFWRVGGRSRPECVWRGWDEPPRLGAADAEPSR